MMAPQEDESLPLADAEEGQTPSENDEEKPKTEFKKPGGVKVMITGGVAFLIAVGIGLAVHLTVGLPKRNYHGAVAADISECSVIGTDMISKGGSAVDAAVASMLCLGVMHGQSSGLGGGGFMVVRSKDGDIEAIDFRSIAAALSNVTMFVNNRNLALRGGLAVAVPGELKALWEVHQKYGLLDWSELFQPSIQLAKNGFRVTEHLAHAIDRTHDYFLSPRLREIYTPNGVPLQENDTAYNPNLANTLGMLANGTQGLFYDGPIAKSIVDEVKAYGGILEVSDFKNYSVKFSEPLQTKFGDFKVFSPQPPSSGAVLISILNILSGYDDQKNNSLFYHRLVEGYKFAYAQRSHLGDPAFVNITALIHNMTSLDYAAFLREHKIDDNATHHASYYGPAYDLEPTPGTTHLSVLGPDGDAVAVTSTVNTYFGSKLMTSTGIVLNNDMDDFSSPNITNIYNVRPSPANYIAPGKRPLSSQAPTLVIQRKPGSKKEFVHLATGASGGTKITTATAQVILYSLGMNDDVESAVERRRIHNQLMPNVTEVEDGFSDEVVENLRQIGHRVSFVDFGPSLGVVQAARADYPEDTIYNADAEPILTAHSDKRKGGIASVI
ncbi:glutathione hydrolase 1 proenzyme-like [Oscarella lobularis]|uniref:glutathione hydrolase 1 proenzyme-like n=1 Tax=Oscarella lobularis TaxID=121494 RepID=UPI0033143590